MEYTEEDARRALDLMGIAIPAADVIQAGGYLIVGDYKNALYYSAMIIPGADLLKIAKVGKVADIAGDVAKVADNITGAGKATIQNSLPAFDITGKVHGVLPKPQELSKYSKEELVILKKELQISVQTRIQKNIEFGSDLGHAQRQALERQLIKSIDKILGE
jgi:hypothetical protein